MQTPILLRLIKDNSKKNDTLLYIYYIICVHCGDQQFDSWLISIILTRMLNCLFIYLSVGGRSITLSFINMIKWKRNQQRFRISKHLHILGLFMLFQWKVIGILSTLENLYFHYFTFYYYTILMRSLFRFNDSSIILTTILPCSNVI